MQIEVHFYSYFKELTGVAQTSVTLPENATLNDLLAQVAVRFPKWAAMQNSSLIAVGVEYQTRDYALKSNDEVSLFPPVQGG
ncbi:MAG TPA: MoaD/ThiS family protein [Verrucomicrobiae bacterium]|jgi:molybdopterin converting factor small subunit|nr:MoaD/ThiS family protein [Verrucomicrobiae bacterium]